MTDDKQSFSWTVLMGDGLLLLCAMMGFAGSFLSLYGNPKNAGRVDAAALDRCAANGDLFLVCAALFGLATLTVWSLLRSRGAAAGGLTALLAVVVLWNRAEVTQGAGVTVREITALFSSRVYWGQVFDYKSGLFPKQEAVAVQLFLLLTLAGLALLLGWVVVRSRRWWMVVLLTLPPLLPGLLADLYPDWLSFMSLAACWCVMLLASLCRWAVPSGRGKLMLTLLPTVALVLALISAIFPREGYTRPAWARGAGDSLISLTNRLPDYFSHWDGPFRATVTYVGSAGEADLAHAGPLSYTGRTVLRVLSNHGGWMYLRGSSLAVYKDGVWKALPSGTYKNYWSDQEPEVPPLYLPAMQEQAGRVYTVTVDNVGAVGTCVYTPYYPLPQDVNATGMLPVEDAYFARKQDQWTHTVTFADRHPQADTGAYGSIPGEGSGVDDPVRSSLSAYTEYVYENYLDVPEDLRETLEYHAFYSTVAISFRPADNEGIYLADRFAAYLDTLCEYDAGAPAAPAGVDPVYYFLTESRRGYCMHYASAVTLMLRTAGIPARYVSGFAAEVYPNRRMDVPDRAAHAWVEVWVDGFGWYPVEVTPDAAFAWARPNAQETDGPVEDTREPAATLEPTAAPEPTATTPEPTDGFDQPAASLPGNEDDVDGPWKGKSGPDFTVLFRVLKGAAPVVGVFLLIWLIQFSVKCFRAGRMSGSDSNRSALICYGYLCRLGRWGGRMNPQAEELALKARFSQHTLTEEELGLLRYLVDRERARLCVAPRLPTRLVFRYWWGRPKATVPPTDRMPMKQEE